MQNIEIEMGNPAGLLHRGPSKLTDPSIWTQYDSDILAHLLQVHAQIRRSQWYATPPQFTDQGTKTIAAEMPHFEQFVFVAVYFRQFTMQKDALLAEGVKKYCGHTSCVIRQHWIDWELTQFNNMLDAPPFPFPVGKLTLRQVFDAYLYGAGLMHPFRKQGNKDRENFLAVHDTLPRARLLYSLNGGLRMLLNHVGNISIVIEQDFAHWLSLHSLPKPDVRWHDRLFDVPIDK
jgi:hypothetical protein